MENIRNPRGWFQTQTLKFTLNSKPKGLKEKPHLLALQLPSLYKRVTPPTHGFCPMIYIGIMHTASLYSDLVYTPFNYFICNKRCFPIRIKEKRFDKVIQNKLSLHSTKKRTTTYSSIILTKQGLLNIYFFLTHRTIFLLTALALSAIDFHLHGQRTKMPYVVEDNKTKHHYTVY